MNENMNDTTAPTIKIATYAQHTASRGRWARAWDEEADGQSDDYVVHEGTREELLEKADRWEEMARTAGAGEDLYRLRMAEAIREAVS